MRFLIRPSERRPGEWQAKRGRLRPAPNWRLRRRIAAVGLIVAIVGGSGWLWRGGWIERQAAEAATAFHSALARAGYKVADILVEGRRRTQRSAILGALGLERGAPIFAFDLEAARQRLELLPWVGHAIVERSLPEIVYVRLREREPLALWQNAGKFAVIDHAGAVVPLVEPETFVELPLLVGEDAPAHAAELLAVLESEPDLMAAVVAAVRVRGRRWDVRLNGGINIRLPEDDIAAAWAQLAHIQRNQGILERDVLMIDLRIRDRLVVRVAPGAKIKTRGTRLGKDT